MKSRCVGFLALLLMFSFKAAAQTSDNPSHPLDVSVCDLISQPSKYNGHLVRVRGQISIAFEDFSLSDKTCPSREDRPVAGVWLIYGGDESTPTIYCCGDHSRKPGEVIKVQGHVIPLLRDEQFWEFRKRLSAMRLARPDGQPCYGRECYLYDVTAILTGHFFAMQETKDGQMSGYGHFGLNHGLFIEQVTDIDAVRRLVPAGGIFDCKSETWDVPAAQAKDILSDDEKCKDAKCHDQAVQQILIIGAKHFGLNSEQVAMWSSGSGKEEAEEYWSSPDLLTTLDFKFPYTNKYIHTSRKELSVTHTVCSARTEPLPQSTKISCNEQDWSVKDTEAVAKSAQKALDQGSDPWRLDVQKVAWNAVQDYAAKYSIALSSNLVLKGCDANEIKKDEYAFCSWTSRDGMQSVWVNLIRYGALKSKNRPKEKTVWVQRSGSISNCNTE